MLVDHSISTRRILKEPETRVVQITHVLGHISEHTRAYKTDLLDIVYGGAILDDLKGNQLIGKKVFVRKEPRGDKPSWFIDRLFDGEPVPENREVRGFAYHVTEDDVLRVFVPGYPNDFVFSGSRILNIRNYVGRWIMFNIDERANHEGIFKALDKDVFLTTRPSIHTGEKNYKVMMPCRKETPSSTLLSTLTCDPVDDSPNVLEAYGQRFKKFEEEPLWLLCSWDFKSKVRLLVSRHQYQIRVDDSPQLPPPPPQQPVARTLNRSALGANQSKQRPLSHRMRPQNSENQSVPNTINEKSNTPSPTHPILPRRSSENKKENKRRGPSPEIPRSPPRQNNNWAQNTEYTRPKRLNVVVPLLETDKSEPSRSSFSSSSSNSRQSRRDSGTSSPYCSRSPPRQNRNWEREAEYTRPKRASKALLTPSEPIGSEVSSVEADFGSSPPRARSPPRNKPYTHEEPYKRPVRKLTANKTTERESPRVSTSEPQEDLAAENALLKKQIEQLTKERDTYKTVYDVLKEQYETWDFHGFLRAQSASLATRIYDVIYQPWGNVEKK